MYKQAASGREDRSIQINGNSSNKIIPPPQKYVLFAVLRKINITEKDIFPRGGGLFVCVMCYVLCVRSRLKNLST